MSSCFQKLKTKWISNRPLIYYPWEPDEVMQNIQHSLAAAQTPITPKNLLFLSSMSLVYRMKWAPRQFSRKCYILELMNTFRPTLKFINCTDKLLQTFACYNQSGTATEPFHQKQPTHGIEFDNDLIQCKSGEYISSLFMCDGHKDCHDGTDELNCICYKNGEQINDGVFCSRNCTPQTNCKCSVIFFNNQGSGCKPYLATSYFRREPIRKEPLQPRGTSKKIWKQLHNDLVFDYPNNTDELELVSLNSSLCPHKHMQNCFPGHSQCFSPQQKCVYNLTEDLQLLMYCRNGEHLQECENASCDSMFKCKMSYCIPFRYVCNGRWDCWDGYDEVHCQNYTCTAMFKCRHSLRCILVQNTCDWYSDCPFGEDETVCTGKFCVRNCVCVNHGISCENSTDYEHLITIIDNFIFINISNSYTQGVFLQNLGNSSRLIFRNSSLTESFLCKSNNSLNMRLLDLGHNLVRKVLSKYFACLPNLLELILKYNGVVKVISSPFEFLKRLKMVDLSRNQIRSLRHRAFSGLLNLKMINIIGNPIFAIENDIFTNTKLSFVIASNFRLCCVLTVPGSVCTAKPVWPFSCDALLLRVSLRICAWIVGLVVVLSNLFSIFKFASSFSVEHTLNEYQKLVLCVNVHDLLTGIYIFIIVLKDIFAGENYIGFDPAWRSSYLCHAAAALLLFSIFSSGVCLLFISISRFQVLKDPLNKFKTKQHQCLSHTRLCLGVIVIIFVSVPSLFILRFAVENLPHLSSPLCTLVGSTHESVVDKVITTVVSPFFLLNLSAIVFVCWRMIRINKLSAQVLDEKRKKQRQKSLTTHLVAGVVTNTLCWAPSALFFLVSFLVSDFPPVVLHVVTLFVLPINSMASPFLFHLSELKETIYSLWGKFCQHKI